MSTAKAKATAVKSTAKQGQQAKQPAPVRQAAPKGYTVNPDALTAAKAGTKPSDHYPQGDATIKLLPKQDRMGANQQANWDAVHGALGGTSGNLADALANGATRRHVRRLVRAGYLAWKA